MARFQGLKTLAVNGRGLVYLADFHPSGNTAFRQITAGGDTTSKCCYGAGFDGIAIDDSDVIYVDNASSHKVWTMANPWPSISLSPVAGSERGFADGDGCHAKFDSPQGMAAHDGVIYVADQHNHRIRTISRVSPTDAGVPAMPRRRTSRRPMMGRPRIRTVRADYLGVYSP